MAKAKQETNNEYLDAAPDQFSDAVQAALADERQIYDLLKAQKAKVLGLIRAEMPMPEGREVKFTAYTRWGQWQIVVGDKVAPKAQASGRASLADWLAQQASAGQAR